MIKLIIGQIKGISDSYAVRLAISHSCAAKVGTSIRIQTTAMSLVNIESIARALATAVILLKQRFNGWTQRPIG